MQRFGTSACKNKEFQQICYGRKGIDYAVCEVVLTYFIFDAPVYLVLFLMFASVDLLPVMSCKRESLKVSRRDMWEKASFQSQYFKRLFYEWILAWSIIISRSTWFQERMLQQRLK